MAASPLLTPVTFASAPWDHRLVVIILRGAMDGLDVVQPYGDAAFKGLRKTLEFGEAGGAHDLDGFFSLHQGLAKLMPLWRAGQLGFAHAVSTPYRDKRSHFDGQDILEAGTVGLKGRHDGWLNRMLQTVPGITAHTAYAIGLGDMLLLDGAANIASWAPDSHLDITPATQHLLKLVYRDAPPFRTALGAAIDLVRVLDASDGLADATVSEAEINAMMKQQMKAVLKGGGHRKTAEFAAGRLREDSRIAAFSINGWDSHNNQEKTLKPVLTRLAETILTLQKGLGPVWDKTAVLAMTEFGRTARENGTKGTDHGTGTAMLMAGGAIAGGKVYGTWPGLRQADLYQGRDLQPTADVRAYAARVMQGLFGLDETLIENAIFPGLDMGSMPRITL